MQRTNRTIAVVATVAGLVLGGASTALAASGDTQVRPRVAGTQVSAGSPSGGSGVTVRPRGADTDGAVSTDVRFPRSS